MNLSKIMRDITNKNIISKFHTEENILYLIESFAKEGKNSFDMNNERISEGTKKKLIEEGFKLEKRPHQMINISC